MPFKLIHPLRLATIIVLPSIILILLIINLFITHSVLPTPFKILPIAFSNVSITKSKIFLRDSIVTYSKTLLGKPYVSAACGKNGFDCSGLVFYVFQHFNIAVPRSSSEFNKFGKTVSIDSAKMGDILVFLSPTRNAIGHVGIITLANGMKSEFIHASSGGEMKVIISSLKQEGYKKRFVKVVDVVSYPTSHIIKK